MLSPYNARKFIQRAMLLCMLFLISVSLFAVTIEITCDTEDAEIRYTIDGTLPTSTSTLYTKPFELESAADVKAIAFLPDYLESEEASLYIPILPSPQLEITRNSDSITGTMKITNIADFRIVGTDSLQISIGGNEYTVSTDGDGTVSTNIGLFGLNGKGMDVDGGEEYINPDSITISGAPLPAVPLPTFTFTRPSWDSAAINGTIGNLYTGAKYVYKIGSWPESATDGTAISGTSFTVNNSAAVTAYVRGFMDGYEPSQAVGKSVAQLTVPNPTLSLTRKGATISGTVGNRYSGVTYRYKDGSAPTSSSDGSSVSSSGTFSLSNPKATTIYVKGFRSGYLDSAGIYQNISAQPQVTTPVFSLTRQGATVKGTISSYYFDSNVTYRYRIGSEPTSKTSGSAVSSDGTFSFTNRNEVTVYVRGFRTDYIDSDSYSRTISEQPTVQTPTLTLTRTGANVRGTVGNRDYSATYLYKIGSAPRNNTDGTVISGSSFTIEDNPNAYTVYIRGFRTDYIDSEAVSASVEKQPTVQTPTLELTRSSTRVTGTVGNRDTSATYRYKIGSAPESKTDGSSVSSSGTFSFTNSDAVTVYVRGFRTNYIDSSAVSSWIDQYYRPMSYKPTITQASKSNTVTFKQTSPSGVTIHYSGCGVSGTCKSGGTVEIKQSGTMTAYSTKDGYERSETTTKALTYYVPPLTVWDHYILSFSVKTIEYGNNLFVAGGLNGKLAYSSDGKNWTNATSPFGSSTVHKIRYGGGVFVAGGANGKIAYSTDGKTWTKSTMPSGVVSSAGITSIVWTGSRFVALCGSSNTIYSTDKGKTWKWLGNPIQESGTYLGIIQYANGKYVGAYSRKKLYTSSDGAKWTLVKEIPDAGLNCVNNKFFLLYDDKVPYSTNGTTWYNESVNVASPASGVRAIGYLDNKYLLVLSDGTLKTSTSGSSWTAVDAESIDSGVGSTQKPTAICYGGGTVIAYGGGAHIKVCTSV